MNLVLKTETFLKHNLTDNEVVYLLMLSKNVDKESVQKSLESKGFITRDGNIFGDYRITDSGKKAINDIVLDSNDKVPKSGDKNLLKLAEDMIALFPKGYQQGNKYAWRCSPAVCVERLRGFFHKFDNDYTHEEILEATKNYIEHYKDSGQMRTLIYFIWNTKNGSYDSPLAAEIEILRSGAKADSSDEDWMHEMV